MSLFDLTGKVAVVTGATKGIGLGIARELARHGAKVVISSRSQGDCDRLAGELDAEFGQGARVAAGAACDLDRLEDVARLAGAARGAFDGVDILVCNAAALAFVGPASSTPPEVFDRLLSTNIHHNFRLCEALRPDIARRGGGSIVLIGSLAGHSASPSLLAYGVAKAGVSHMARSLADEMAAEHIRVNCVAPGLIRSHASEPLWRNAQMLQASTAGIPLQRIGEPEDIAGAVIFLVSRAGSYVTGETLLVDGGRTRLSAPSVQRTPLDAARGELNASMSRPG
ncbi:MAG: short-chain dehydrogenase [Phenylobacterium sp.]|nr:short-chain dehydrogenase [Phenylobacterium sp.]